MMIPADARLSRFFSLMDVVGTFYRNNPANRHKHMDISREDVTLLFQSLNDHHVHYLLVGGMASAIHGYIRATEDLNLWVRVGEDNKQNLIAALLENDVAGAIYLKDTPLLFGRTSVVAGKRGFYAQHGSFVKGIFRRRF